MHDAFDGISHPPKLDPTRPAPVDTVALKQRIGDTQRQQARYATDTGPAASLMRNEVDRRLAAKQDTLAQVRRGKIPAKGGR